MSKKKTKVEETEPSSALGDLLKKLVNSPDQVVQKLASTTSDIKDTIKAETKKYLSKIDPSKEIEKILEKYDFEIQATIRLKKKKDPRKKA